MKHLVKSVIVMGIFITFSNTALASSPMTKNQSVENGIVKCDDVTGIFLQEWIDGERLLNSFLLLKDVSEPVNYTAQINNYFEFRAPESSLEIGCLQNLEGVAIRYDNELKVSTIIQIDNDGRIQTYPESSSFGIDIEKSFRIPS